MLVAILMFADGVDEEKIYIDTIQLPVGVVVKQEIQIVRSCFVWCNNKFPTIDYSID